MQRSPPPHSRIQYSDPFIKKVKNKKKDQGQFTLVSSSSIPFDSYQSLSFHSAKTVSKRDSQKPSPPVITPSEHIQLSNTNNSPITFDLFSDKDLGFENIRRVGLESQERDNDCQSTMSLIEEEIERGEKQLYWASEQQRDDKKRKEQGGGQDRVWFRKASEVDFTKGFKWRNDIKM